MLLSLLGSLFAAVVIVFCPVIYSNAVYCSIGEHSEIFSNNEQVFCDAVDFLSGKNLYLTKENYRECVPEANKNTFAKSFSLKVYCIDSKTDGSVSFDFYNKLNADISICYMQELPERLDDYYRNIKGNWHSFFFGYV